MALTLQPFEQFWRDHYSWLQERGYTLRSRYQPSGNEDSSHEAGDAFPPLFDHIVDATNSKGEIVALKRISPTSHPSEGVITRYFSSNNRRSIRNNHCVPLLDVLHVPESDKQDGTPIILVMPFLVPYNNPTFATVGEAVGFMKQAIEGIYYMHHNRIAHRHITPLNFMMDPNPILHEGFHPTNVSKTYDYSRKTNPRSRTTHPTKYFIVDLGDAREYSIKAERLCEHDLPREPTAPELQTMVSLPYDPFAADVCALGHLLKTEFLNKSSCFEFIRPLVSDMTNVDASQRPTMSEVERQFEIAIRHLPISKLRSRFKFKNESALLAVYRGVRHLYRRIIFSRFDAIPSPPLQGPSIASK
ncbi:hypothetical protein QCA50_004597 [Cerrena zonata]|uniref:Protein kinase domain-containing protein n=1 Tax=Cerrena zonata TaxID=2478898 RepID=A0AAW0GU64_9APHY